MNSNAISAFEYIGILLSIVLGLGITQILSSVAEVLHHHHKVKFYTPHTIWVVLLLFLHVQEWFVIYELKFYPLWTLPAFLFIILYPITLFLCAKLIFPLSLADETLDLKAYYLAFFPRLFFLFAVCIGLSLLFNLLFLKASFAQQGLLLFPFAAFVYIAYKKFTTEWLHWSLAILAAAAMISVTLREINTWYIQ